MHSSVSLASFWSQGIFELYVVRYFYHLGCCSALRTKQDHAITVSEISRFVPPEPNMHLPPQQVLVVAIGNCPNIKVQNKHVQTLKIMSRGPISFSEWVGVCFFPCNSQQKFEINKLYSPEISNLLLPEI